LPGTLPRNRNQEVADVTDVVRREVSISSPREKVWEALTDPVQLAAWFGGEVEIDPRPGGPVRFRGPGRAERRGLVEEVDAPRRLIFRWRELGGAGFGLVAGLATTVAFTLEPDGDGTRLVLTESPGLFAKAAS
jgi:uncharacterized protein YndB with AHSA1/START domain